MRLRVQAFPPLFRPSFQPSGCDASQNVFCGWWLVVCGLWFVVYGLWFGVCGLWFVVWGWCCRSVRGCLTRERRVQEGLFYRPLVQQHQLLRGRVRAHSKGQGLVVHLHQRFVYDFSVAALAAAARDGGVAFGEYLMRFEDASWGFGV